MGLVGIYPIGLDKSLALDRHLIVATFNPVWFLSLLQKNGGSLGNLYLVNLPGNSLHAGCGVHSVSEQLKSRFLPSQDTCYDWSTMYTNANGQR